MAYFESIERANLKEYDSNSDSITLDESIKHGKLNVMSLSNSSDKINFNNEFYTYDTNLLHDYKEYLKAYTITIDDLPEKYFYKPEWLAKELYGSADLWYLIMWFNEETPSVMEFNKQRVTVFNPAHMDIINKLIQRKKQKDKRKKSDEIPFVPDLILKEVKVKDRNL